MAVARFETRWIGASLLILSVALSAGGCRRFSPEVIAPVPPAEAATLSELPPRPTPAAPSPFWSPPETAGEPLNHGFRGMTCFRGNAQRNYYGEGPVPEGELRVLWRRPIGKDPQSPQWNGTGWTGQPLAVEWPAAVRPHMNFHRPPGPATELIVGAMDGRVHFYDAATGQPSRPALVLPRSNIIKGTVTVDPRGYPLLYVGNGLNRPGAGYRVFSLLDFSQLAFFPGKHRRALRNWPAFDANGLVLRDHLLLPGENGLFYRVRLNTRWEARTGELSLRPQVATTALSTAGAESSASVWKNSAYCTDSRGTLYRLDLARPGAARRLRQLGDDADASITFDADGSFYTGIEVDHRRGKGARGAVYRLASPDGELLWKWEFEADSYRGPNRIHDSNGGLMSTPAVWPEGGLVFITTSHHPRMKQGALVALDRETGQARWKLALRKHAWSSPVVVDGRVIAIDTSGALYVRDAVSGESLLHGPDGSPRAYFPLGKPVESTPLVWNGRVYVGTRGGAMLCVGSARP